MSWRIHPTRPLQLCPSEHAGYRPGRGVLRQEPVDLDDCGKGNSETRGEQHKSRAAAAPVPVGLARPNIEVAAGVTSDDDDCRECFNSEQWPPSRVSWAAWHARKGYFIASVSPAALPCVRLREGKTWRGSLRRWRAGNRREAKFSRRQVLLQQPVAATGPWCAAHFVLQCASVTPLASLAAWWILQHPLALCSTGMEVGMHLFERNFAGYVRQRP
jgi:hypothetical protein